jgi:hypothetical protein
VVEARLDAADRQRRDGDPAVVEGGEELGVAAAAVAEQVGLGHPAVGEGQAVGVGGVPAELVVGGSTVKPAVPDGTMTAEISGRRRRAARCGPSPRPAR